MVFKFRKNEKTTGIEEKTGDELLVGGKNKTFWFGLKDKYQLHKKNNPEPLILPPRLAPEKIQQLKESFDDLVSLDEADASYPHLVNKFFSFLRDLHREDRLAILPPLISLCGGLTQTEAISWANEFHFNLVSNLWADKDLNPQYIELSAQPLDIHS